MKWRGPGIETEHDVALPVADDFWREREKRNEFPRGLDLFFTAGHQLIGLPRSTRITQERA
ncbi:carbon-phosphorus lyase complex subunit [compost metagenome]